MSRRTAAHLRLVSDSHIRRHFGSVPDMAAARELLQGLAARPPRPAVAAPGRRPLWIYGAGEDGRHAYAHLQALGQAVSGIIDDNAAIHAHEPDWAGVTLLQPGAVPAEQRGEALVAVAVTSSSYGAIEADLNALGWLHCMPLDDVAHALGAQPDAQARDGLDGDAAATNLSAFSDALSRAHYLRALAWWLAREEWEFAGAPVQSDTRFFIPEITRALGRTERALDAGAGRGRVIRRLLDITGNSVSAIWAVEPDGARRAELQAHVNKLDLDMRARVLLLDAILCDSASPVRFRERTGEAARIVAAGGALRAAVPLDALSLDPSFMTLHLEGGELAALRGAHRTLLRHRPMLAVSLQPNATGLVATAAWLLSELSDTSVLLRTHGWCGSGTVLYAIPKERARP